MCFVFSWCWFPFTLNSLETENEKCDTPALTSCRVLTDDVSPLLRPAFHLSVERLARYAYRLVNRSASQSPFIQFEVPRRASVLRYVYPPSTVKDDHTLAAQLIRRDHEWILHVEGELQSCPGGLAAHAEFLPNHIIRKENNSMSVNHTIQRNQCTKSDLAQ